MEGQENLGTAHVGVDLATEQVVLITRDPEHARDCYLLRGRYAGEGLIVLERDDTWNGRRAAYVALASQGCGLGWTFALDPSDPVRTLADLWTA